MIIDKLIDKIKEKKNPSVVGLDPRLEYIPDHIKNEMYSKYGKTLMAVCEAFYKFNTRIIDAICDIVPAVKPQIAMYEMYGHRGIECYIKTIHYAKLKGLIVIGDIKRSDIATTAEAYSSGHIGMVDIDGEKQEVYSSDFITLNPYLGSDSVQPFLEDCKTYNKGLFILVKTSNRGGGIFQDIKSNDKAVYNYVGEYVRKSGLGFLGEYGYSSIGAVVGATYPEQLNQLRKDMPSVFFLIPGFGAQGGSAADVAGAFDKNGIGAIVNSSRGIIAAYQSKDYSHIFSPEEFDKAAAKAAKDMKNELNSIL